MFSIFSDLENCAANTLLNKNEQKALDHLLLVFVFPLNFKLYTTVANDCCSHQAKTDYDKGNDTHSTS